MLAALDGGEPTQEALSTFLERREAAVKRIRRLDKAVADTRSSDPAAEIVAASALRRSLERAASCDASLREALAEWHARLARAIGGLVRGRRSLRAYRGGTPLPAPRLRETG